MAREVAVIGVPSSAGASWPGLEKGPAAYRAAGIIGALQQRDVAVDDRGDLPVERWQSALAVEGNRQVNNVAAVMMVANQVKAATTDVLARNQFPLVLGGDCTITVGAFAGALQAGLDPALIYVDGGWDVSTPATTNDAHLDGMGVAHLLALPLTTRLRDVGPRTPMLTSQNIVFVGQVAEDAGEDERAFMASDRWAFVGADAIRNRGEEAAHEAVGLLSTPGQPFLLHFDVDVIDFFDLPVADVPVFRGASRFADVADLINVLAGDDRCLGMVVTEFNPDHAHPDGREARVLVKSITDAVARTGMSW